MDFPQRKTQETLTNLAKESGIGVGDVIAKITKFLNIPQCGSCERRKQLLNKLRVIGWKVTWDEIKDL